jgi:hypothetical protein
MRAPRNNPWKAPIIPEEEGRQRESEGGARMEEEGGGGEGELHAAFKQTDNITHILTYHHIPPVHT